MKITSEEIKKIIEGEEYEYLMDEYRVENNRKRRWIKVKCNKGHTPYWVRLDAFKRGCRCSKCAHSKFSYEEVKEYIESFGYKMLSIEYMNNREKIDVLCPMGHKWSVTFSHFKNRNQRCPKCSDTKHDYDYIKQYFYNYNYELLSNKEEYKNIFSPLRAKCSNNHIYITTFHRFKNQNCRCPICNMSKGEKRIMDWLNKNNIRYHYNEEYFEDLLSIKEIPLRPDFILPDYKIWIEYDGIFHYEEVFDGQNFDRMKFHDDLKNEYAEKNGWKLIRIPYWDYDNIENVLKEGVFK